MSPAKWQLSWQWPEGQGDLEGIVARPGAGRRAGERISVLGRSPGKGSSWVT